MVIVAGDGGFGGVRLIDVRWEMGVVISNGEWSYNRATRSCS